MKTKLLLSTVLAVAGGFAGFANTASAGDLKIFGVRIPAPPHLPAPPLPTVVVPRAPSINIDLSYSNYPVRNEPRGYWKEVVVQDWVPARWVVTRGPRGREYRTFEKAHYVHHTERVWVSYRGNDRGNDRDHDGRRD